MIDHTKNITRLFNVFHNTIGTINGNLDYNRLLDCLNRLCELIEKQTETENIWYIGEGFEFCLDDLLVGAYWHLTEYHNGQNSKSYKTLCNIGQIYKPNYEVCDPSNFVYQQLNEMVEL